jgi:hypothetical protein
MATTLVHSHSGVRPLYRGTQVVWYVLNALEVLLAFRFVLRAFGANPAAGFSSFVYGVTYPFAEPFLNVFSVTRVPGATIEWTTLLAMAVYWLLAWAVVRLLVMGKPVSDYEAEAKLESQDVIGRDAAVEADVVDADVVRRY